MDVYGFIPVADPCTPSITFERLSFSNYLRLFLLRHRQYRHVSVIIKTIPKNNPRINPIKPPVVKVQH